MKSREEYQASIFAKRDALLKKRKKHIMQAVSGIGAVVLLTISFTAIQHFTETPNRSNAPTEHTTISEIYKEECVTQTNPDFDALIEDNESKKNQAEDFGKTTEIAAEAFPENTTEMLTMIVRYPVSKKHSNMQQTDVDCEETVDEMVSEPAMNDNIRPTAEGETYSDKEIADAAYSHLSPIQKLRCSDTNSPDIMPVTSSSQSVYYVTFKTISNESYRVILRQNDLGFVETVILSEKEIQERTEPVTFADGYKGESQWKE